MTNEEKILSMLEDVKKGVENLQNKNLNPFAGETPEEGRIRRKKALEKFVNSKTDDEEPEATAEFFRIMEETARRKGRFAV